MNEFGEPVCKGQDYVVIINGDVTNKCRKLKKGEEVQVLGVHT